MTHPHHIELLAPARDADIGIEAINHGADAVYIGGPAFGARASAGNSLADIERLIAHAHRYHARIFIALNTILRDDELEAARRMAWQVYEAGADALIVQDMGLLEIDLPPIQLHASTQCDIRTAEKARFLQDVGFSQIVLARELTIEQIAQVRDAIAPTTTIEFFIHGALCVAYSGQCFISHAHTGRSANRGDCNQACRLPYEVRDAAGRIVAHDKHVLSMKDNNQSANLCALLDAGVRSFKIEGRYKDMGYVKNITAHYRRLLDEILEMRPDLVASSHGRCTFSFTPDPAHNFNRDFTDYFTRGRQIDIGAFDTPKSTGTPIGWVSKIGKDFIELHTHNAETTLHNGDGLCYPNLQARQLIGVQVNRAEKIAQASAASPALWRIWPNEPIASLADLRRGTAMQRNRDMHWDRTLAKKSSDRRVDVWAALRLELVDGTANHETANDATPLNEAALHATAPHAQEARPRPKSTFALVGLKRPNSTQNAPKTAQPAPKPPNDLSGVRASAAPVQHLLPPTQHLPHLRLALTLADAHGHEATASALIAAQPASDTLPAVIAKITSQISRLGNTIFALMGDVAVQMPAGVATPFFIPASTLNALRRDAAAALEAARAAALPRLPRAAPVEPPVPFGLDHLTYLGNVLNHKAHDFYRRHGVQVIDAAYESKEELGEVSLMITKHCVRFSMSLCPKQAKGVIGVKGTIRAEPMQLINGREKLTLRFDCKRCEMHVVGKMKPAVLKQHQRELAAAAHEAPIRFYKKRPEATVTLKQ